MLSHHIKLIKFPSALSVYSAVILLMALMPFNNIVYGNNIF